MLRSAGARRLRKPLRRCPAGAINSPEKCLVDLGLLPAALASVPFGFVLVRVRVRVRTWDLAHEHPVPPTCSKERRQLEPELAFWSEFPSA